MIFNSIRWRLTFLMIFVAILPMIAVGAVITFNAFQTGQSHAEQQQQVVALRLAQQVQTYIEDRPRELRLITDVRGLGNLSPDEQESILSELLAFDAIFDELVLLDSNGFEAIQVSRREVIGPVGVEDRSASPEFLEAVRLRQVYYSPVRFDIETGEPLMTIGIPMADPRSGEITNVLVGEFRLRALWDLFAAQDYQPGQDIYLVLTEADEIEVGPPERVVAHRSPSVVLGGATYEPHGRGTVTTGLNGDEVVLTFETFAVGGNGFVVVAELTTDEAYKEAYRTIYTLLGGLGIILILAGLVGYLVLRQMTRPIVVLADAAERLGGGDLSVQVDVKSRTELGTLGRTFNTMAGQLREVFGTLEARVQARTRDLQLAAQVSEQMSTILDPDQLLPQVVELIKQNFDLYHVHIYLYDDRNEQMVLAAGAGEPGRIMKSQGHSIPLQARSLVARAARTNEPSIVNNVREDPDFLANPLLPDTHAEAAFPLSVGDQVLGVLDVQSEQVDRFEADMLVVLSTLAGQIAVSLENARLFSEVARASRHEHTLGLITQEIQRATSMDDVLQAAARELGKALRVPYTRIQLRLSDVQTQPVDGDGTVETLPK